MSGERGEIHVGYAPSLTIELLPRALRLFRESNGGVRVQLHDLSTEEMLRRLREGGLDVALLVKTSAKSLTGLKFEELHRPAVCVAMHPAHRLARIRKVGIKQLLNERLIAYTRADYPEHHAWLTNLFVPFKRLPQISEEHDSSTSLIASVEAGRGIALVLQGFECLAGPRLKVQPLIPAPPHLAVGVAFQRETNSPTTRSFIVAVKRAKSA